MKLLLTSGGVTNTSIHNALIDLLGKPISECHALCIPTAQWGHPMCGPASVQGLIAAKPDFRHLTGLGWASLGVLELTALPTIGAERWIPWVREADVLLVDGGDATYLCHWMRESGLAELLPSLTDMVWVGVSAGSMVMTPRIGSYFVEWTSAPDDRTLGVVDFSIFPHLNAFPTNTWRMQNGGLPILVSRRLPSTNRQPSRSSTESSVSSLKASGNSLHPD
jgi:dipeptidase E